MIIRLDTPKILSDAISIISELVTEVRIKMLEDGLSIVAVDPANISMILFKIPKESFSEYQPSKMVLGVNLEDLKRILKRAANSSSIILEQEENQLKISIFDKIKRNFVLSLIDIDTEDKQEPALSFTCEAEINSVDFSQAVEDSLIVADSCSLEVLENTFVIEGKGKLNSSRTEFSSENVTLSGSGRSKYSLEYLSKFAKAKAISEKVSIRFANDYPLRIDFAGAKLGIGFVLAPRVETD